MKAFWRYGSGGKQRLIRLAFDSVKDGIEPMTEEAALSAVHAWLLEQGYFSFGTKAKREKFSNPDYFWAKDNYGKHRAYLAALANAEFFLRIDKEMAQTQAMLEQYQQWEEAYRRMQEENRQAAWVASYEAEVVGSYWVWAAWISAVYWGVNLLKRK